MSNEDIEIPRSICGEPFLTEAEAREHEQDCKDCTALEREAFDD